MHRVALAFIFLAALQAQPSGPEARARRLVDLLAKQDFTNAQSMLDDALGAQLSAATLHQMWDQVQRGAGVFRRATSARIDAGDRADVVFLTCEFEKATLDARLPVDKAGRIGGFNFSVHADYTPPDYIDISSFHEKDVIVGAGEWALHGTVTIPNGTGPFPALVLVHGSGANDRDSTLGPNKPFRDLAWGIASRGIVVLRYNKRANEHPMESSKLERFTTKEETTDDALSAVALLRGIAGVDKKKIFVLGHSLGGTLMPRVGKADPDIAGLVVLGGATYSLLDLVVPQYTLNFTLHGAMTEAQRKVIDQLQQQIARAKDPALTPDTPKSEMPFGLPASYWLDLRDYHPEQTARELKQPLLILQGERDYQVTMSDFENWKKGLASKRNVTFHSYPRLNHLFMPGEGQSSDEEYARPSHVERTVIEDIAAWVKKE